MATIFDFAREDDRTFGLFLEQRSDARSRASSRLIEAMEAYHSALEQNKARAQALQEEMVLHAATPGDRLAARMAARRGRKESDLLAQKEWLKISHELGSGWYLDCPAKATKQDQLDYSNAVAESLDRDALDPVLTTVPGARKAVDQGWTVYFTRNTVWGKKEILRVMGDSVALRSNADEHIRAALLLAKERYQPPLRFSGQPAFRDRCERIAQELGIGTVTHPDPTDNTISGTPAAPSTTPSPAASPPGKPPSASTSAVPAEAPAPGRPDPLEVLADDQPLIDMRDVTEDTAIAGTFLREAVVNDQPFAVIATEAGAVLVRMSAVCGVQPGAKVEAQVGREGAELTPVEEPVNVNVLEPDEPVQTSAHDVSAIDVTTQVPSPAPVRRGRRKRKF
ncbi:MAG: LPD7 domain-containing protein [Vulcanimicrobiaceae bacterium]